MDAKIFTVEEILSKYGALPSSKVKQYLLEAGLSEEAARQRISRAKGNVRKLSLKLPKRERFLYLAKQYRRYEYWDALINALLQTNSSYGVAIYSMLAREKVIPLNHFDIVSGSPKKLSKHLSSSNVKASLIEHGLLKQIENEELGDFLAIDARDHFGIVDMKSKKISLLIEDITINAVSDWLKKIGIASYNAIKIRSEDIPSFGSFGWDITAPSYIHPLVQKSKTSPIPGFIVVDIVVNKELTENHVKYFINKCRINRQFKNMKPFLAMLVAERFTEEAFKIGKKEGVIFTTFEILFGKEIVNDLKDLTNVLKNAAVVAASNPQKFIKLFSSLGKIEGAALNLRGALFELVVGHLVCAKEGGSIDIGVKVSTENGKFAEIDVRRVMGQHEVTLYECKGKQPTTEISDTEIKKWIDIKIPIMRDALLKESRFKEAGMIFEYWTTGIFSADALALLNECSQKTRKYSIRWKNGDDVLSYARQAQLTSMIDILTQHYLKHPLS